MTAFRSIRSRILAFAVIATVVPSLGLGLLTYWRYQALVSENVAVELRTLGNYARSELSMWIGNRVDDVRALSTANTILDGLSPAAKRSTETRPSGARRIEAYLRSVQGKLGSMLELSVFDSEGKLVASSAASPTVPTLPAAWVERVAADGVLVHRPHRDGERAMTTLTVVVPILSIGNGLLGAVCAVLDLGRVQPRLEGISKSSGAEVVLLAPGGEPLLGTRGGLASPSPVSAQTLQRIQARPGEPATYLGHRGREVIGLASEPGRWPIAIVAERESADVYHERRRLLELFAAFTSALTLLVGALAWWIGRSIVDPLEGLVRAVDLVAGGDLDVRLRPAGSSEIGHLTRALNKMVERLRHSRAEVEAANEALQGQNRLLEQLSVTDGLTGLNNRTRLGTILAEQFALFRRHRRPFAVVMLDLDHFTALNDTFGHLAGDRMLQQVAGVLKGCVRSVDHVARYGGEEFAAVLVEATLRGALDTAERIRASIEASQIVVDDRPISVTVSLGVARSRDIDARPEDVLARADDALYEAKRGGRNRVCCAEVADPAGDARP